LNASGQSIFAGLGTPNPALPGFFVKSPDPLPAGPTPIKFPDIADTPGVPPLTPYNPQDYEGPVPMSTGPAYIVGNRPLYDRINDHCLTPDLPDTTNQGGPQGGAPIPIDFEEGGDGSPGGNPTPSAAQAAAEGSQAAAGAGGGLHT
jgi:hypothetical protein